MEWTQSEKEGGHSWHYLERKVPLTSVGTPTQVIPQTHTSWQGSFSFPMNEIVVLLTTGDQINAQFITKSPKL